MRLRELRQNNRWTLNYVAAQLGVSSQTIGNWEANKTEPDIKSLIALANLFQVSIDYLVGRDNITSAIHDLKRQIEKLDADYLRLLIYDYINKITPK